MGDVELRKTIIASVDPLAVDASYAAKAWWNLDVPQLRYLRMAGERGLGRGVFESLRTKMSAV